MDVSRTSLVSTTRDLVEEANDLVDRARALQEGEATDDSTLTEDYHSWYAACLAILDDDLGERFRKEFDGNWLSPRIRGFLESPKMRSMLFDLTEPEKRLPAMSEWQHPVETAFVGPIRAQQLLLREQAARRGGATVVSVDVLLAALRRFSRYVRPLVERRRGRAGIELANEYDVQDAVEALLSSLFDDVRPEEHTPSHAAGSSSIDFLVPAARLAVEVKMTRPSLRARDLVDELAVDIERYRSHPDVALLIAFVYDPLGAIRNRAGFEQDLKRGDGPLQVHVVVVG